MTTDFERQNTLDPVQAYAENLLVRPRCIAGETTMPVSDKIVDPSGSTALVGSSFGGWWTAERVRTRFEWELALGHSDMHASFGSSIRGFGELV